MSKVELNSKTAVIPTLRYRDGKTAIAWLSATFGFEKKSGRGRQERRDRARSTDIRQRDDHVGVGTKQRVPQPRQIPGGERRHWIAECLYLRCRYRSALRQYGQSRCGDRHGDQGRRLRRPRLFLPGPRRSCLELRQLRPMDRMTSNKAGQHHGLGHRFSQTPHSHRNGVTLEK
jgi:hypothetical protein